MNLDLQKMKRLSYSGIDINKLAPQLFEKDLNDQSFTQKSGGILDWYLPDFDKSKRLKSQSSKWRDNTASRKSMTEAEKEIYVTDKKIQFSCHMNTIVMGELGEIGWYLKLENKEGKSNANSAKQDN